MKVISLGMGVQSTAMYLMSSMGILERADAAIFADPCAEHPKTYEILDWLVKWQSDHNGIPLYVDKKDILSDILNKTNGQRVASIPSFTEFGGMIRRQCTSEYKVMVVKKRMRQLMGLKKGQRMKPSEIWLGITMDEASRMKDSQMYNVFYCYPLICQNLRRSDCIKFFDDNDFPVPIKSSCVFCPYHSDKFWKQIKDEDGYAWETSLKVDEKIRENSGLNEKNYLHAARIPLTDVQFADQASLWEEECEGYCGL